MQLAGRTDFREIGHKLYRIIYRIEGDDVVVYGVADGRRDMQSFLHRRLVR
jgi:toxin ParE1/3/4